MEALGTTPVEIRLAPEWAGYAWARRPMILLGGLPVLTLLETPLSGWKLFVKAVEDRVLSLIALILLSPVLAAAAIAIRLDSPGPILFRQLREGYNCRPFPILKFRTMYVDQCHRGGEMVQTTRDDPRVTRVGAFLRRTSIDELPQLFNVLSGAMSLVGPRPHAASTRAGGKLFGEIRASYPTRHNVKPGLTGWAQVCGWRGETTSEEMLIQRLQHDLYYVEHCSLLFDLYILARTATIVLFQRAAY
jgi:exopolysaccharide biosynthesis polyprenyl glycosylphosphotransferase